LAILKREGKRDALATQALAVVRGTTLLEAA
jgi:hypothetical protein